MSKILGYRELSDTEVAMINEIKAHGEAAGALVEKLKQIPDFDQRWVSIGKTDLQTGFMALARAVAQPTTF